MQLLQHDRNHHQHQVNENDLFIFVIPCENLSTLNVENSIVCNVFVLPIYVVCFIFLCHPVFSDNARISNY